MAGLVFKARDDLSLYANYIEGLTLGTTVGSLYQNAGEVFPPFKTKQMEVGAKWDAGRFTHTVSLFQIKQPATTTDNSTQPLPTMRLGGEQRNRGIEWSIFGEVAPRVRALGGITYMQGKLTRTQGGINQGNKATGTAPWQANLGGEWDPLWLDGLTLTGRVVYTSSQYADNANSLKMPSWTRVDVGARYATRIAERPVTFRAGINNLFDRSYWEGIQYPGLVTLGAPRTFQLSATVDF